MLAGAGLAALRPAAGGPRCRSMLRSLSAAITGWLGSTSITSYHLCRPSSAHPRRSSELHISVPSACPLLCDPLDALAWILPVHAHVLGPSVPYVSGLAKGATSDLDANDSYTLLGLVSEGSGPVKPGWPLDPLDGALAPPLSHPLLSQCPDVALRWGFPSITDVSVESLQLIHLGLVQPLGGHIPASGKSELLRDKPFPEWMQYLR